MHIQTSGGRCICKQTQVPQCRYIACRTGRNKGTAVTVSFNAKGEVLYAQKHDRLLPAWDAFARRAARLQPAAAACAPAD
eukprot:747683-Hanusia_phi.AAC.1